MQEALQKIGLYLLDSLLATGYQLFIFLGPLVLLAFLMNLVARYNEDYAINLLGVKGYLYGFGWLGTSIHELAHAFFAVIFLHKIHDIKLFSPNMENGYLGYVSHDYNPNSFYQTIGCFFVGIGPILLCPLLLILVTFLLYDLNLIKMGVSFQFKFSSQAPFISTDILAAWNDFLKVIETVIYGVNATWWKFALFIYLFFAIGSSIALSKPDIDGALIGFFSFVILLFLLNLATQWYGNVLTFYVNLLSQWMGIFYLVTILALLFNLSFLVIVKIFSIFN